MMEVEFIMRALIKILLIVLIRILNHHLQIISRSQGDVKRLTLESILPRLPFLHHCLSIYWSAIWLKSIAIQGLSISRIFMWPPISSVIILIIKKLNFVVESKRNILVLLAGTSGTGKSTLSSLLGSRLGISTVLSTDTIRHVMRNFVAKDDDPIIFASTYETAAFVKIILSSYFYNRSQKISNPRRSGL